MREKEGRKPYVTCQKCGAHLDYGEKCDCERSEKAAGVKEDVKWT